MSGWREGVGVGREGGGIRGRRREERDKGKENKGEGGKIRQEEGGHERQEEKGWE